MHFSLRSGGLTVSVTVLLLATACAATDEGVHTEDEWQRDKIKMQTAVVDNAGKPGFTCATDFRPLIEYTTGLVQGFVFDCRGEEVVIDYGQYNRLSEGNRSVGVDEEIGAGLMLESVTLPKFEDLNTGTHYIVLEDPYSRSSLSDYHGAEVLYEITPSKEGDALVVKQSYPDSGTPKYEGEWTDVDGRAV